MNDVVALGGGVAGTAAALSIMEDTEPSKLCFDVTLKISG